MRATLPVLLLTLAVVTVDRPAAAWTAFITDEGHPTRWAARELTFVFDSAGPEELGLQAWIDLTRASAEPWSDLECASGPRPFDFTMGGVVEGRSLGFVPDQPNENLIMWIHSETEWLTRNTPRDIAVTGDMVMVSTGEILDSDIEFNDAMFEFSDDPGPGQVDVLNTMVHELGHALGLDHSIEPHATMFFQAELGETYKRDLTQDDVDGYCALYGRLGTASFELVMEGPPPVAPPPAGGCSADRQTRSTSGPVLGWLLLLGLAVLRRRATA